MQVQAASIPTVKPNASETSFPANMSAVQAFEQLVLEEITQLMQTDAVSAAQQISSGTSSSDEILQKLFAGAWLPMFEAVNGPQLTASGVSGGGESSFNAGNASSVTSVGSENASGTMGKTAIDNFIAQASDAYGVPGNLIKGVVQQESGMNVHAVSGAGAMGLMQLMPGTAQAMGVSNPFDPQQNVMGGTKYLSQLLTRFGGDQALALAAYNAGPAAVEKYGGIPPYAQTQDYVHKVLSYANAYA